jgi:hypothetical protein
MFSQLSLRFVRHFGPLFDYQPRFGSFFRFFSPSPASFTHLFVNEAGINIKINPAKRGKM